MCQAISPLAVINEPSKDPCLLELLNIAAMKDERYEHKVGMRVEGT